MESWMGWELGNRSKEFLTSEKDGFEDNGFQLGNGPAKRLPSSGKNGLEKNYAVVMEFWNRKGVF